MADGVLDASAVLAMVKLEPGADLVAQLLPASIISTVNLSEAVAKLVEWDPVGPGRAWPVLHALDLDIIDFDTSLARRAGELRAATRRLGLSFSDRACLALAEREGLPVYTSDRAWADLHIGVEIRIIR